MFAESLLESTAGQYTARRRWTTAASFTIQLALLSLLAIVPSIYPEVMSLARPTPLSVPIFSSAPPPQATERSTARTDTQPIAPTIAVNPSSLTFGKPMASNVDPGVPEPNAALIPGTKLGPFVIGTTPMPTVRPAVPTKPLVISDMDPGSLIHRVQPIYPKLAVDSRTEGQVRMTAIISAEGNIESVRVISGHPFLARAAEDAVRQWRYRPYILNGHPIEVETQIIVNFKLGN